MRKLSILALATVSVLSFSCKKDKKQDAPIEAGTYYELTPLDGGSSITFNDDYTFTLQNLRVSSIAKHIYSYKIENGKMIVGAPIVNSYLPPNPLDFGFTADGRFIITNFRPSLWPAFDGNITFKKR